MVDDTETIDKATVDFTLPTLSELLLSKSLYDLMQVNSKDEPKLHDLRVNNFQIDAFCTRCQDRSIFKTARTVTRKPPVSISSSTTSFREESSLNPGYFTCIISCVRCSLPYLYYFLLSKDGLSKIGQFPSLEDIGSGELLKYRSFLDKRDYGELKRATGLFAHGIGIGAFVYLRRIFERLINSHRETFEQNNQVISNFETISMEEKIKALSSVLPPALVQHRKIYSILSVGIHALDEATCRKYFPVVKTAIMQILNQDIAAKEAAAAAVNLTNEIAAILGEVNNKA